MKITSIKNYDANQAFKITQTQTQPPATSAPVVAEPLKKPWINLKTTGYSAIGLTAATLVTAWFKQTRTAHKVFGYLTAATAFGHLGVYLYNKHQYKQSLTK